MLFALGCAGQNQEADTADEPAPKEEKKEEEKEETKEEEGPKTGGELIVGNNADAKTLDPHLSSDLYSSRVFEQVFETLVAIDFEGNYVGVLAESWEVSDDGTVWTFMIRDGVKFHDGTEMTVEDVKFSLERVADPETKSPHRPDFAVIDKVNTPDEKTVEVVLKEPSGVFMNALLSGQVVPKAKVEELGEDFNTNPVGTGPFEFVEWIPDDHITVKAFEDYWDGRAHLDKITFRPIPEASTRLVELETGGIHLMGEVPGQELERLEDTEGIKIDSVIGTNYRILAMNTEREPFDDKNVRQAIAHAVDKQKIIDVVYPGVAIKAEGPLPPTSWAFDESFKGLQHDMDKAKELLAESDYPDGFEVKLMISEDQRLQRDAVLIQSMLEPLGIVISIESVEWGTFLDRLMGRDYDMLRVGWTTNPEPDSLLYNTLHSSSEKFNFTAYNNPQVDELLDQGRQETDIEERKEIYRQVQEIVVDDAPMAYLYHERRVVAEREVVQGFKPHLSGAFMFKTGFGADVWLDE
jgi:peptide/nickel transport system substrate-binding protein